MPYAQMVVGILLVGQMADSLANQGIPTIYPFIQEEFRLSRAQVGLISSAMILGSTTTLLLVGWLVDTLGVRKVLTVAPVCTAVFVTLLSQVQSLNQAIAMALLTTAAASALFPASARAIIDWVSPRARSLAMGIEQTSVPIGGVVAAALLPFLAVTFSWRYSLMVLALLIVAAGMVVSVFYREHPESMRTKKLKSSPAKSLTMVASNRDIWIASLAAMTMMALHFVVVGYLILFLTQKLGISTVAAGGFLALFQASGAIGRIGWGLASDLLLNRRRALALALTGVLSVVSMSLMVWLPSDAHPVVVGVVVFVVGTSVMAWASLHAVLVAELTSPALTGTVIGFSMTIMRIGAFGIPTLFGFVVDRTGSYDVGWWMMAGFVGAGTLSLAFLRPEARDR